MPLLRSPIKKPYLIFFLLLLFALSFLQALPLLLSYRSISSGLGFIVFHDSLWHLSLIEAISRHFPPYHPGISGVRLVNYHYFSDLFLNIISRAFHLPPWWVYFRLAPLLAALVFNVLSFLLAYKLSQRISTATLAFILASLGGSLAWVIPLLSPGSTWFANSFMLDQPFDMLTNVHTYFGFSLFLLCLFILSRLLQPSPPKPLYLTLFPLALTITYATKSYAAVILVVSLLAFLLHSFLAKKLTLSLVLATLLSSLWLAAYISLTSTPTQAGLSWAPGWLLDKMVEDQDRLPQLGYIILQKQHFLATDNWFRLSLLYAKLFFIYLAGNLGFRLIGFFYLIFLFAKSLKTPSLDSLVTYSTLTSLLLPLFFNQSQSAYNIIQFGQYGLILTAVYTALALSRLKPSPKPIFISSLVLGLALPTSLKSISQTLSQAAQPTQITPLQLQALNFLKSSTPVHSVILTHPDSPATQFMIIPALAARTTYFSSPTFAPLTGTPASQRIRLQQAFFDPSVPTTQKVSFLRQAKINYIYLENHFTDSLGFPEASLPLSQVFTNPAITIFQVKP